MTEDELLEKLRPVICKNCSNFKSEHRIWCPDSGRTRQFKPGGYTDIPQELVDLIVGQPTPAAK